MHIRYRTWNGLETAGRNVRPPAPNENPAYTNEPSKLSSNFSYDCSSVRIDLKQNLGNSGQEEKLRFSPDWW